MPTFSFKITSALLAFTFLAIYTTAYAENLNTSASSHDPFRKTFKPEVSSNNAQNNLEQFPCAMLRLAGVLQQGPVSHAILFDPHGQIYQVNIGDIVGLEKAKITSIFTDKITLNAVSKNNQPITLVIANNLQD